MPWASPTGPGGGGGEQIKVFVVLKKDARATEKAFIDFHRTGPAVYKLPTRVKFKESQPKSNVDKRLRKDLGKEARDRVSTPNR